MDFTREPIIETVVTPKEGCKLVIRSSKSIGQEEYFVDAVQVVSFGNSIFFRSLERPKAFLLPASDYEVLEVREARIVLKNVPTERSIKIGGGREGSIRSGKEPVEDKEEIKVPESSQTVEGDVSVKGDLRTDKRRDRRRQYRRKRGREEGSLNEEIPTLERVEGGEIKIDITPPEPVVSAASEQEKAQAEALSRAILSELLTPPPSLISETIARYKDNALFKGVFITSVDEERNPVVEEVNQESEPSVLLNQPAFGSFEMNEEDEEEIYRQRKRRFGFEEEVSREHRGKDDHPPLPEDEPPYTPEGL